MTTSSNRITNRKELRPISELIYSVLGYHESHSYVNQKFYDWLLSLRVSEENREKWTSVPCDADNPWSNEPCNVVEHTVSQFSRTPLDEPFIEIDGCMRFRVDNSLSDYEVKVETTNIFAKYGPSINGGEIDESVPDEFKTVEITPFELMYV